jgi:hypothetical protein
MIREETNISKEETMEMETHIPVHDVACHLRITSSRMIFDFWLGHPTAP